MSQKKLILDPLTSLNNFDTSKETVSKQLDYIGSHYCSESVKRKVVGTLSFDGMSKRKNMLKYKEGSRFTEEIM